MPKIISFAWTTPALLAGAKTVTRREWDPDYANKWKQRTVGIAYDKNPRFGGKPVGLIELVKDAYLEKLCNAPESDYEAEGLAWLEANGHCIQKMSPKIFWELWKKDSGERWVVRFKILELFKTNPSQTKKDSKQRDMFWIDESKR